MSGSAVPAPAPTPGNVSVAASGGTMFTSGQSAATFAGGSAAITIVWQVLGAVLPAIAKYKPFPVFLALGLGSVFYWLSPSGTTAKEKWLGFVYAVLNSFTVAAAALGITSAVIP